MRYFDPSGPVWSRTAKVLSALILGALLAACTITSQRPLVGDDEGAAPLPDAFTYFPYQASDAGYVRSSDAPASFVHDGNRYVANDIPDAKGPLSVAFVPLDNGLFLIAATAAEDPGVVYGFARYADGVLSIALSPGRHTAAAISRERKAAMPQVRRELRGLSIDPRTDEITLKSRAALDELARLYAENRLPMEKLSVGYLAEDPTAPPPSRLVPSGRDWIKVP